MNQALEYFASGETLPRLPPELCERIRRSAETPDWFACYWCGVLVFRRLPSGELRALHKGYRIIHGETQCSACPYTRRLEQRECA